MEIYGKHQVSIDLKSLAEKLNVSNNVIFSNQFKILNINM
jgi:hypothetical protein